PVAHEFLQRARDWNVSIRRHAVRCTAEQNREWARRAGGRENDRLQADAVAHRDHHLLVGERGRVLTRDGCALRKRNGNDDGDGNFRLKAEATTVHRIYKAEATRVHRIQGGSHESSSDYKAEATRVHRITRRKPRE